MNKDFTNLKNKIDEILSEIPKDVEFSFCFKLPPSIVTYVNKKTEQGDYEEKIEESIIKNIENSNNNDNDNNK